MIHLKIWGKEERYPYPHGESNCGGRGKLSKKKSKGNGDWGGCFEKVMGFLGCRLKKSWKRSPDQYLPLNDEKGFKGRLMDTGS